MSTPIDAPRAFLLDLDGTLYAEAGPIPGGPAAVEALRRRGMPFRCVTNTTSGSRAGLAERLAGYGYHIAADQIITPASAAVRHCRQLGFHRVRALVPPAALPDLDGLELAGPGDGTPDAVLLGDLGAHWTFALLQEAFTAVLHGAALIALSKDRYYQGPAGLTLDGGLFVAGLEYATGASATVVGKPSGAFYRTALASLDRAADGVVMVGDDLWSDIEGAQRAGLTAWLVRTGKFREQQFRESGIVPERVLGSVAEIGDP